MAARKKVLRKTRKRGKNRSVVEVSPDHDTIAGASVTYQLERVKCGKPRCRKWHGPYWYAYWTAGGKTRTLYIGKQRRPASDVATELLERRKNKRSSVSPEEQKQP